MPLTAAQYDEIQRLLREAIGRLIVITEARIAMEMVSKASALLELAYDEYEESKAY